MQNDLENLQGKEKCILEAIEKLEIIIEDCTYWNMETENLDFGLDDLKYELERVKKEIEEIENSNSYKNQLEYQRKEYRKMQGF